MRARGSARSPRPWSCSSCSRCPLSAASTKTRLSGATVSPRSGTPATTIVVTVVYQNANGSRAEHVTRVVRRRRPRDEPSAAADRGARASRSAGRASCRPGRHPVSHHGASPRTAARRRSAPGPSRSRRRPRPTPKPTPEPRSRRPKPTPKPTAEPTSTQVPPRLPGILTRPGPDAAPTPPTAIGPRRLVPPDDLGAGRSGSVVPFPAPERHGRPERPVTAVIVGGVGAGGPGAGGERWLRRPGRRVRRGPAARTRIGRGPVAGILAMVGIQPGAFPGMRARPDPDDDDRGRGRRGDGARPLRSPPTR